jgi:hypothetical protein
MAKLETPNHDRITRPRRTAPVRRSTFARPKNFVRASTIAARPRSFGTGSADWAEAAVGAARPTRASSVRTLRI